MSTGEIGVGAELTSDVMQSIIADFKAQLAADKEENNQLRQEVKAVAEAQECLPMEATSEKGLEVFVERYGTEMLIEQMSGLNPSVQTGERSARSKVLGKIALDGLFNNERHPTMNFHDLAHLFGRYYAHVAEEFFREWSKEELGHWKDFVAFHGSADHEESDPEKIRTALRSFLNKEKALLEYRTWDAGNESEKPKWVEAKYTRTATDTLRNVLDNSANMKVLMTKLPGTWYGDNTKSSKISIDHDSGVKKNYTTILKPGAMQWDRLIAKLGESLVQPMNRVAVNALLSYGDCRIDSETLYKHDELTSGRDPLDEFHGSRPSSSGHPSLDRQGDTPRARRGSQWLRKPYRQGLVFYGEAPPRAESLHEDQAMVDIGARQEAHGVRERQPGRPEKDSAFYRIP